MARQNSRCIQSRQEFLLQVINMIKRLLKSISSFSRAQKGISLIEALLAVALVAAIVPVFMQALSATSMSTQMHKERVTATSLALWQIENIKAAPYREDGVYSDYLIFPLPVNYQISLSTEQQDVGKQEVTAEVRFQEDFVYDISTMKVKW